MKIFVYMLINMYFLHFTSGGMWLNFIPLADGKHPMWGVARSGFAFGLWFGLAHLLLVALAAIQLFRGIKPRFYPALMPIIYLPLWLFMHSFVLWFVVSGIAVGVLIWERK